MSLEMTQPFNDVTTLLLLLIALVLIVIAGICVLIWTTWAIGNRQNRPEQSDRRSP